MALKAPTTVLIEPDGKTLNAFYFVVDAAENTCP